MTETSFQSIDEAFRHARDMDAPLRDKLETFSRAARALRPGIQEAVDRLVERLAAQGVGTAAPDVGEIMPSFVLPNERGELVSLEGLRRAGPVAVTFNRGHWCPYCRIAVKSLAVAQARIAAEGGQIVAIMPDRYEYAAAFRGEAKAYYPVLSDMDNGYALSLNLAIWVGSEVQSLMAEAGRDLPRYQGNDAWLLPVPASFVVDSEGYVRARFIDPDYRRRMAIEDLIMALRQARSIQLSPW